MNIFEKYLENIKLNKFEEEIITDNILNIVNNFDENGRTLLHWAAFLGNNAAVIYLLKNGANPLMVSENDENFQAIHFAAVNNHVKCIETLLEFGVSIESCDMYRRTPLNISAFYGRIIASMFLLSRGADLNHQDMNGNHSIHFASLSGNSDLCQILLYSGVDIHIKNDFGETPFHLACRKGSKRLLKSLMKNERKLITQTDNKGINAFGHAKFNHNSVGLEFLRRESKKSNVVNFNFKTTDLMYGRGGSKYPLMLVIFLIYFWAIPVYIKNILYLTYFDWPILNWLLIVDGIIFTLNLYAVNSIEPSYLPRYTKEYDETLKNVSLRNQNENEILEIFSRLCHTCRTVRPLRASHCGICRRCVKHKDHHCPYVYNCIGFRNRQYFLLFLITVWIGLSLGIFFAGLIYFQYGYQYYFHEYFGLGFLVLFYGFVTAMIFGTLANAFRNITTNESLKWQKFGYEYLRTKNGQFANPFDKGWLLNFLEYFRIIVEFKNRNRNLIEV